MNIASQNIFTQSGEYEFVSLATFRKSGERVATPVWIARDNDALLVTTTAGSGKVKRLRNNPHVEIMPCNRRGKVVEGAEMVGGSAEIITDGPTVARLSEIIKKKYGLAYRIIMLIEKVVARGQRSRVILRIT